MEVLLAYFATLSASLMFVGLSFVLFDTRWITRGKFLSQYYEVDEFESEKAPRVSHQELFNTLREQKPQTGIDQQTKTLLDSYKIKIEALLTSLDACDQLGDEIEVKNTISALADSWKACSSYEKTTCHFLRSTFCKEMLSSSTIEILHKVRDPEGTAKWLAERALTHMFC
eukprot:GHVP01004008.1.p1 GENE.GHVP01004008.1~~GHVP01004008.1.p1  ORF type:complete len:190 (+),score=19.45 GHVP01004008.1:60-572(+)